MAVEFEFQVFLIFFLYDYEHERYIYFLSLVFLAHIRFTDTPQAQKTEKFNWVCKKVNL